MISYDTKPAKMQVAKRDDPYYQPSDKYGLKPRTKRIFNRNIPPVRPNVACKRKV
jgi:hypothetical protein